MRIARTAGIPARKRAGPLVLALAIVACEPSAQASPGVQRVIEPDTVTLITELVLAAAPGSQSQIGKPRGVVEAKDGSLLVLDSDWKRVSHFTAAGAYLRPIGAGYGWRTGQFALPVSIAKRSDQSIVVYDYEARRLTAFDTAGNVTDEIPLKDVHGRSAIADLRGIVIRLMWPEDGAAVLLLKANGSRSPLFRLDAHEESLYEAGAGGAIAGSVEVGIVYVNGDGSTAYLLDKANTVQAIPLHDRTRMHDKSPSGVDLPWVVPERAAIAAAITADRRLAIIESAIEPSGLERPKQLQPRYMLYVYELTGTLIGRAALLPQHLPLSIDASSTPATIYVSYFGPTPQVVRYRFQLPTNDSRGGTS